MILVEQPERLDVFLESFGREELAKYSESRYGFSALGEVAFSLLWLLLSIDSLSKEMIAC